MAVGGRVGHARTRRLDRREGVPEPAQRPRARTNASPRRKRVRVTATWRRSCARDRRPRDRRLRGPAGVEPRLMVAASSFYPERCSFPDCDGAATPSVERREVPLCAEHEQLRFYHPAEFTRRLPAPRSPQHPTALRQPLRAHDPTAGALANAAAAPRSSGQPAQPRQTTLAAPRFRRSPGRDRTRAKRHVYDSEPAARRGTEPSPPTAERVAQEPTTRGATRSR